MIPITDPHRPEPLRGALRDAAIAALSAVIGGSLGFVAVTFAVETGSIPGISIDSYAYQSAGPSMTVSELPAARARTLSEGHDCWTGSTDLPADMRGEYPGHVVVTRASAEAPTYSAALVGAALDKVFGSGPDTGLTVHAFCR